MAMRRSRSGEMVIISIVLFAAILLQIAQPGLLVELRLKTFDFLQQLQPRQYVANPVRIVDIDDESLRRLGQWPWPRSTLAELIQRLTAGHAAVLALDFIFSEADRSSPSRVVSRLPNVPEGADWI